MPIRIWLLVAVATALAALSPMGAEGAGITPANGLIAFASTSSANEYTDPAAGIGIASPDGSDSHLVTRTAPGVGEPAWSPDGRRVALTFGTSIGLVNADATGLHSIGHPALAVDRSPAWSPSGHLAFIRTEYDGGYQNLVIADGDGARQRTILHGLTGEDGPVWSRDGRSISLLGNAGRDGLVHAMVVVDVATRRRVQRPLPRHCATVPIPAPSSNSAVCVGVTRVTAANEVISKLWLLRAARSRVVATGEGVGYPAWSPDATHIAYSQGPILGVSAPRLVVLALDTGRTRTFRVPERDGGTDGLKPSWSNDGRRIVVGHLHARWLIATVDVQTAAVRTLVTHTRDESPRWSPDGTALAFLHLTGSGDAELRVRALQGPSRTIAHGVATWGDATRFAWSPDSQAIAFVARNRALITVSADGAQTRTLATGACCSPAWSPDSKTLAYTTRDGTIALIGADGVASPFTGPPSGRAAAPTWSPDGASLFYVSPPDGYTGSGALVGGVPMLWTFAAQQSKSLFACFCGQVLRGVWSPDGTKIFLTSIIYDDPVRTGFVLDLWNFDDSLMLYSASYGTWSPDGAYLALAGGIARVPPPGGTWQPGVSFAGDDPSWQPLPK